MVVVKVGGGLFSNPKLKSLLTTLSEYATQQTVVIVPGGGPFADQVRAAQVSHQFDEQTAHHMAILAMAQFGLVLASLCNNFQLIHHHDATITKTKLSIWLPNAESLSQPQLPPSWDITSDSIALWFAQQKKAERLLLIKSCSMPKQATIRSLTNQGIIDTGFETLYIQSPIPTQLIDIADYNTLPDIISQKTGYGLLTS